MAKHKIQNNILLATVMGVILLLTESGGVFSQEAPKDDSAICRECHLLGREPVGFPKEKIPGQMRKSPEELKRTPQRKFWPKTKHSQVGNICTNCHDPYTLKGTKFLIESTDKLCLSCHTVQREKSALDPHRPVKSGRCIMCHSPHGSALEHQLRHQANLICVMCHQSQRELLSRDYPHKVVVEESCAVCHEPHGSAVENRLKKAADDLCLDCHEEKEEDLQRAQVHHPALTGQCMSCHNPHGADNRYRLIAQGRDLCLRCHWQKAEEFSKFHSHAAAELKDDCLTCHTAHCADFKGMLISEKSKLCYSCHQDVFAQFQEIYHHPIEVDEEIISCTSCHSPHGTEQGRRLLKGGNKLCFNCHPEVESLYLNCSHDDDDMFCMQCHHPHASSNEKRLILAQTQLCYLCHEEIEAEFDMWSHHPIIASSGYLNCSNCHNPHLSTATQKIIDPDDTSTLYGSLDSAFCLRCHDGSPPSSVGGTPTDRTSYLESDHINQELDCSRCHNQHGTDNADLLVKTKTDLCLGIDCHASVVTGDPHLAMADVACVSSKCHDGSPEAGLGPDRRDFATASGPQHYLGDGSTYLEGDIECATCHESEPRHDTVEPYTLESGDDLCYRTGSNCHGSGETKDIESDFSSAEELDRHNVPEDDVRCYHCHNAHLNSSAAGEKIVNPDSRTSTVSVTNAFCLSCHDGAEPTDPPGIGDAPLTSDSSFYFDDTGPQDLHDYHIGAPRNLTCDECHVAKHGSSGNSFVAPGTNRHRHLRSDITVNAFPYTEKPSCSTPGRSPSPCH